MASKFLSRVFGSSDKASPTGAADADTTLSHFFTADHRSCDDDWVAVESAAESGDADGAAKAFAHFDANMRKHLAMEEEVLFPAFEDATGMHGGGPTAVMRMEHERMRALLTDMAEASKSGDHNELVGQGDTLLMLIQQHNRKEEGMLYPMADNAIGDGWAEMRDGLRTYEG